MTMAGFSFDAVETCPDGTAKQIRQYLRSTPSLRKDEYGVDDVHSLDGHCYVAAEAYYHARGGRDSGLDIYCLSWSDVDEDLQGTHWYLVEDDIVVDLAVDEPADAEPIPFSAGRRRSFLTGYDAPSQRTLSVLNALGISTP